MMSLALFFCFESFRKHPKVKVLNKIPH